jgi:hypothetical protein
VLETAKTNSPSRAASRATTAFHRGSSAACAVWIAGLGCRVGFEMDIDLGVDLDIGFKLSSASMALVVIARKGYG